MASESVHKARAEFRAVARRVFGLAAAVAADGAAVAAEVREPIASYNTCGLCDPARSNMYPFVTRVGAPPLG